MTIVSKNRTVSGHHADRGEHRIRRGAYCTFLSICCVIVFSGCDLSTPRMKEAIGSEDRPVDPIEAVTIADANNLWIVTDAPELIRLKNGSVIGNYFDANIAAVDFRDTQIGWALMKTGGLFQTRDGGESWSAIGNISKGTPFGTQDRLKFVDENVGWIAAGEYVFRTEDGGRNWKEFSFAVDEPISGITAFDRNEFWCVSWAGSVNFTLDGGVSWRTKYLPRQGDESYPRTIARDGDGRIWVGNIRSEPKLYVSEDRGDTWAERSFPADPGTIRVTSIQFAPGNIGRIVFRRIVDTDRPIHSSVVASTDSGKTWQPMSAAGLTFEPRRIEYSDPSVGFMIGRSEIAKTVDGGRNWIEIYRSGNLHE